MKKNINILIGLVMEAETSRFNIINVNATYFTSTPTVCGHAEACPSTTYTKQPPYLHPIAVAARCGGVTPTNILEDSGRVLNPILTLIAIDRKSCKNFGISWSNHRILKLERPPPDFPKLFAPHRVPAWLKYFDGVHGRPLGVILGVKFIKVRITFFLLV